MKAGREMGNRRFGRTVARSFDRTDGYRNLLAGEVWRGAGDRKSVLWNYLQLAL